MHPAGNKATGTDHAIVPEWPGTAPGLASLEGMRWAPQQVGGMGRHLTDAVQLTLQGADGGGSVRARTLARLAEWRADTGSEPTATDDVDGIRFGRAAKPP